MNRLNPRVVRCLHASLYLAAVGAASGVEPADEVTPPYGELSLANDVVRTGSQAKLAWKIEVPSQVKDIVEITPDGPITPKEDLTMRVRIIGLFQAGKNNNGHGNNLDGFDSSNPGSGGPNDGIDLSEGVDDESKGTPTWFEVYWASGTSGWTRTFSGDANSLDPATLVEEIIVQEGVPLSFAARGWNGGWMPLYSTSTATPNVVVLRDGDKLPDLRGLTLLAVEDHLDPYITSDGHVEIGPRDLLILVELEETDPRKVSFDLQDLAILVTFE